MTKCQVEILPSAQEILQAPARRDELDALVRQKVAEIMAERDALVFEPFFRSRQVSYELKRLQSVPEQQKFSIYFERYGCMKCETRTRPHAGNGMCARCRSNFFGRLAQIIGEGIKGEIAKPARGASWGERLLPEDAARDGMHRTYYHSGNHAGTKVSSR
jgi:hypothetical protein